MMMVREGSNEPGRRTLSEYAADWGMAFAPVARETLHEQIYQRIKERLFAGQFSPGQKLPLRSLARALGTSAMPVRDALQRLESIGVLTATPNRTMAVPVFTERQLQEIRDIRVALEGLAADWAAQEASPGDIAALEAPLLRMEASAKTGNSEAFLEANWVFHFAVARAAHSEMILSMIEPLWLKLGPTIRLSKPEPSRVVAAVPCHRVIFEAIRAKDGSRARAAIIADITGCFDMLRV
jgi:DNA-binding GntR family transcriptional regulator